MTAPHASQPSSGLSVHEVFYILLRQRWKILVCTSLGLLGAVIAFFATAPVYQSDATLLVQYIIDSAAVETMGSEREVRTVDNRGETIMNSEVEILASMDLARRVATNIGPARIIPGSKGDTNVSVTAAALAVNRGLSILNPRRSNNIKVTFRHSDPELAQAVLQEVVQTYKKEHEEIHGTSVALDVIQRQVDQDRMNLNQVKDDLQKRMENARILSLADAKAALTRRLAELGTALGVAQTDLAQQESVYKQMQTRLGNGTETPTSTNLAATPASSSVLEAYRSLGDRLGVLRQRETQLAAVFTPDYPELKTLRSQIAQVTEERLRLEKETPSLVMTGSTAQPGAAAHGAAAGGLNSVADLVLAARTRAQTIQQQIEKAEKEASDLLAVESSIVDLERQRDQFQSKLNVSMANLERARKTTELARGGVQGIKDIQTPTVALKQASAKVKIAIGLLVAGLALGLTLAFVFELLVDQTIKRPAELENRFHLPVMITIPSLHSADKPARNGTFARRPWYRWWGAADGQTKKQVRAVAPILFTVEERAAGAGQQLPSSSETAMTVSVQRSPVEMNHFIRPFCDALRDRLILYFQLKHMTHKPKLVAITSCSSGAGATTIASGLAAALSETGDGKVLLVDMNMGRPDLHPFFRGQLAQPLVQLLSEGSTPAAAVGQRLYIAAAAGPDGSHPLQPKRFFDLMPQLRASDFDYIVFDMPSLSQTSATLSLAAFMDQVFLVVEGEETRRDTVRRAYAALSESKANVTGIFNKNHEYGPRWLQPAE